MHLFKVCWLLGALFVSGALAKEGTLSGSGTSEDPWQIEDYVDLKAVGSGSYGLAGTYRLMADIDASASASENSGAGFVPIGNSSTPFTGSFNGAGHVIKNLTIYRPSEDYVGLFGYAGSDAKIDSLGLVGGAVTGGNAVGGLMGHNDGTVSNSYLTGAVTGVSSVGGLVGEGSLGTVSHSYSTGAVTGSYNVGGLMGSNGGTVSHSYSTGAMTGNINVGGLVGYNSAGTVGGSYWDTSTSGTSMGIGYDDNSQSLTGLSTTEMKQFSSFSGWDFVATWQIHEDQSYPGLRSVDNAPFAFVDTLYSATTFDLKRLLANDYDVETSQANLILHVDSLSIGTTDSTASATFPEGAAVGDTLRILYRVGEVRATQGDTLWGNQAKGVMVLRFTFNLAADSTKTYGDAPFDVAATYTDVDGNSLGTVTYTSSDATIASVSGSTVTLLGAGKVTLTATTDALWSLSQTLTINPKALTVTADAQSKVYGTKDPALTYSAPDLVSDDALTLSRAPGNIVGEYAITLDEDNYPDYEITYTGAKLTITPKALTVTADAHSKVYGTKDPTLTYSAPDLVSGDVLTLSRASGDTVGEYAITLNVDDYPDYEITYTGAKLTIHPKLSGSGTNEDPWQIEDYADLKAVGSTDYGLAGTYRLMADIDASASASENSGAGFAPIGNSSTLFKGSFNGAGHVIKGLTIYRPGYDYVGLFGYAGSGAKIDSLGLVGGAMTGSNYVGGLVGTNGGTVSNSYSTGAVTGSSLIGGLVGINYSGTVSNSYSTGAVMGSNYVGGLVGYNYSGTVSNSYSTGAVMGSNYVGGLVGYNDSGVVSGSYWDTLTSGTSIGIGLDNNSQSATGLTTAQMKQFSNFSGWDFVATWQIHEDQSYPGLRSVDNAPFAFVDTLYSATTFDLKRLLANDYDVETSQANLILHVDSLSIGTTDSTASATFPEGAAVGDTLRILYRVGEVRATQGDTLWGNQAKGVMVLRFTFNLAADSTKTYGDAPFDVAATYTDVDGNSLGTVTYTSSDTTIASVSGSTVTLLGAGNVTLTATTDALWSLSQTLTINPKALTVTADAQSKVYGTKDPALTYSAPDLVSDDALTLSRAPGDIVGEYAITLDEDDYPDYEITYTGAKLTISKAALTVTVHDTTMVLNADEPDYRFTFSGFVNGDTKSVLSALKATHNTITKAGTYTLTPTATAANYTLTFVNGKLTVTSAVGFIAPVLAANGIHVQPVAGGIQVQGLRGRLDVFDLKGTRVTTLNVAADGIYQFSRTPGIYMLRSTQGSWKVVQE